MSDILNSDQFAEWFLVAILCIITWVLGRLDRSKLYLIHVPSWLRILVARRAEQQIPLGGFRFQVIAILLFVWETILVSIVPSHTNRIFLLGIGIFILMLLAILLKFLVERSSRNSKA